MASRKRFIDAGLFEDEWYCDLEMKYKLAWIYLMTNCGHDGIWKVSQKLLSFNVGENVEIIGLKRALGSRVVELDDGRMWFIPKYITFQYGANLSPNNRVLKQFYDANEKYNLLQYIDLDAPSKELQDAPSMGLQDGATYKDKVKDKVKDKDTNKTEYSSVTTVSEPPSVDAVKKHLEYEYDRNASRFYNLSREQMPIIADMYVVSRDKRNWKDGNRDITSKWKRDCEGYVLSICANGGLKSVAGRQDVGRRDKELLERLEKKYAGS
jgi:hypothetical protein